MPPDLPAVLREFPAVIELPVLWRDMDAFRHVNNATYLTWFESSRVEYLRLGGLIDMMAGTGVGPILASITCNYRRQLRHPDRVWVGTRVAEMTRTGFRMEHLVYSHHEQAIAADGASSVVIFHYDRQRPVRVPVALRERVEQLQGPCP